jgi:hypothetical protein
MQKLKERNTGKQPPKKPASAYIVKEMSSIWNRMTKEDTYRFREAAKRGKNRRFKFRQGKI